MFGLAVLEIAIGMIFVYLLLALVCTAANELIAGWFDRRGKNLELAIRQLLLKGSKLPVPKQNPPPKVSEDNATGEKTGQKVETKDARDLFYEHPLIKALHEPRLFHRLVDSDWLPFNKKADGSVRLASQSMPAYIPAHTFAAVLLDILVPADPNAGKPTKNIADIRGAIKELNEAPELQKSLLLLVEQAGTDLEKLQVGLERWFNDTMERVSGWYKQRTQWMTVVLALIVTVLANADSIRIARTLANNAALREALVVQAQEYVKKQSANSEEKTGEEKADEAKSPEEKIKQDIQQLQGLGLDLGWKQGFPTLSIQSLQKIRLERLIGLLITAFAVSLGAPFWFDTLNKIITIRAAGKSPKESKPKSDETLK